MPKIGFHSISCERINGLGSYFVYILLAIPSMVLSPDIFHQFSAELLTVYWANTISTQHFVK